MYGGAKIIGNQYILWGQDTLYLEKFNVTNGKYANYTHQYMQNIEAPYYEASNIYKAYQKAGVLERRFVFKIPVYENMPASACAQPEKADTITLDKTSVSSLEVDKSITLVPYVNGSKVDHVNDMIFTSSNTAVAVVDAQGKVTAISPGDATISCTRSGASSANCTVTVVKGNPVVTTPVLSPVTYREGIKLSDVALPSGWTWADGDAAISVGTPTYAAVYTPGDTTKYNTITKNISFTVTKAIPACQVPAGLEVESGAVLGSIALPNGFFWESDVETVLTDIGEYTFYVSYNQDENNYYTVSHIPVIVQVKETVSEQPSGGNENGNSGDSGSGTGTGSGNGGSESGTDTGSGNSGTGTGNGNGNSSSSGTGTGNDNNSGSDSGSGAGNGSTSGGSTSSGSTSGGSTQPPTSSGNAAVGSTQPPVSAGSTTTGSAQPPVLAGSTTTGNTPPAASTGNGQSGNTSSDNTPTENPQPDTPQENTAVENPQPESVPANQTPAQNSQPDTPAVTAPAGNIQSPAASTAGTATANTNGAVINKDTTAAANESGTNSAEENGFAGEEAEDVGQPEEPRYFRPSVTIQMEDTTILTPEKMQMAKEQNFDLLLDMGGAVTWSIDVDSIDEAAMAEVDMGIALGTSNVPQELISTILDGNKYLEITLAHQGVFGFEPVLNIALGKEYSGKYANLFYYNPETENLEFICDAVIGPDGVASLCFEHASCYLIIVSDESMSGVSFEDETVNPVTRWIIVGVFICMLLVVVGYGIYFFLKKRREEDNDDEEEDTETDDDDEEDEDIEADDDDEWQEPEPDTKTSRSASADTSAEDEWLDGDDGNAEDDWIEDDKWEE